MPRVLFAEAAGIDGESRATWLLPCSSRRLATALATGQALGFVGEGDPMVLAFGVQNDPRAVFQAWLYGEGLKI